MKSKFAAASLFGLVFAIIFACVSLVTPSMEKYECGGKISREIMLFGVEPLTIPIGNTDGCAGGRTTRSVGFPQATKSATISSQTVVEIDTSLNFQVGGLFMNAVVYWSMGFVFFMVFGTRRKPKVNKRGEIVG